MAEDKFLEIIQKLMADSVSEAILDARVILEEQKDKIKKRHKEMEEKDEIPMITEEYEVVIFTQSFLENLVLSIYGQERLKDFANNLVAMDNRMKKSKSKAKKESKNE